MSNLISNWGVSHETDKTFNEIFLSLCIDYNYTKKMRLELNVQFLLEKEKPIKRSYNKYFFEKKNKFPSLKQTW